MLKPKRKNKWVLLGKIFNSVFNTKESKHLTQIPKSLLSTSVRNNIRYLSFYSQLYFKGVVLPKDVPFTLARTPAIVIETPSRTIGIITSKIIKVCSLFPCRSFGTATDRNVLKYTWMTCYSKVGCQI